MTDFMYFNLKSTVKFATETQRHKGLTKKMKEIYIQLFLIYEK